MTRPRARLTPTPCSPLRRGLVPCTPALCAPAPRSPLPVAQCAARSESVNACLRVPALASQGVRRWPASFSAVLAAPPAMAGTPTRAQRIGPPPSGCVAPHWAPSGCAPSGRVAPSRVLTVRRAWHAAASGRRRSRGALRASGSACRRGWRGEPGTPSRLPQSPTWRVRAGYPQAGVHGLRARRRTPTALAAAMRARRCARQAR